MPQISFDDISGGMRRTPPRIFPNNAIKYACGVIPDVENRLFITSPPCVELFNITDSYTINDGIVMNIDGIETVLILYNDGIYFYLGKYTGSFSSIGTLNLSWGGLNYSTRRLVSNGEALIIHPFLDSTSFYYPRQYYKKWKYTREDVETDARDIYDIPEVPTQLQMGVFLSIHSSGNDRAPILSGDTSGVYHIMGGFQLNGFESITFKDETIAYANADEDIAIRALVTVTQSALTELVSGIDIYIAKEDNYIGVNASKESGNWKYVDTIPMDQNELIIDGKTCTIVGSVITCAGAGWDTDQWIGFVAIVSGLEYRITDSDATTLTVSGTPDSGAIAVDIRSKWILVSSTYYCAKFLTSTEGEALVDKCGVSNVKIIDNYDYCPYARHVEYFKGFVWMADYIDRLDTRHKNRLIVNVVNSEGQSCISVYDTDIFYSFEGDILGLKAFDDYMLVLTTAGVYTVRFMPTQGVSDYNWSIKRISKVKTIPDKKYVTGTGNTSFLFDGQMLYGCDGYALKPIFDDEQVLILKDYKSLTATANNYYSLYYHEKRAELLIILKEKIVRFKKGIFLEYIDANDTNPEDSIHIGEYNGNVLWAHHYNVMEHKDYDNGYYNTRFNVEFHKTDLGTKEDKYFIICTFYIKKEYYGTCQMYIYLDGEQRQYKLFNDTDQYDDYIDIAIPKDKSRRFTDLYIKFQGSTEYTYGIQFEIGMLDVELEPVRRTFIANGT